MNERAALLDTFYREGYNTVAVSASNPRAMRFLHSSMEAGFGADTRFDRVLEVGANRGEHLPYVRHQFGSYVLTDLRVPRLAEPAAADPRVTAVSCDVQALPFATGTFDRSLASCLMHHVPDPLGAALELRRVTKVGGVITVLVPTDPYPAYRLVRALTSTRSAKKAGKQDEWQLAHALDHKNHFWSIRIQLQKAFRSDSVKINWRPFLIPSPAMNLLTVWQVRKSPVT